RSGRDVKRLLIIVVATGVAGVGIFALHKHRKKAATAAALEQGLAAYESRQYTQAAINLGKYLTVDSQNIDVLLKYAESQLHRRPQSRGSSQQAVSALETINRIQPGQSKACDLLTQIYFAAEDLDNAERIINTWHQA